MQARMVDAVHDLVKANPGKTVLVVPHATPMESVLADALGVHLDLFQRIVVSPGSVSAISYGGTSPSVVLVNWTGPGSRAPNLSERLVRKRRAGAEPVIRPAEPHSSDRGSDTATRRTSLLPGPPREPACLPEARKGPGAFSRRWPERSVGGISRPRRRCRPRATSSSRSRLRRSGPSVRCSSPTTPWPTGS